MFKSSLSPSARTERSEIFSFLIPRSLVQVSGTLFRQEYKIDLMHAVHYCVSAFDAAGEIDIGGEILIPGLMNDGGAQ